MRDRVLSIQIVLGGFSLCVQALKPVFFDFFSADNQETVDLERLTYYLKHQSMLKGPFKHVFFNDSRMPFTLVPKSFFKETHCMDYLEVAHFLDENQGVMHKSVENKDLFVVYAYEKKLADFAQKYFNTQASLEHIASVLLEKYRSKNQGKPEVFVHLLGARVAITVLLNNELKFFNLFSITHPMAFLYYVLYTMNVHKVDGQTDPVYVSGTIKADDDYYKSLKPFVRNLQFLEKNAALNTYYSEIVTQ